MNKLEKIEQLVNWEFPTLRSVLASGPMGNVSHAHRTGLKARADAYRAKLFAMSQNEFTDLYDRTIETRRKLAEIAALREEEARFFNQPSALADYNFWTKADYWTLDEALILALGREPNVVSAANLAPFRLRSPFVTQFLRLQTLALRAKTVGKLSDPVLPVVFIGWAMDTGVDVPAQMRDPVMAKAVRIDSEGHSKKQSELIDLLERKITSQQAENATLRASLADLGARATTAPAPRAPTVKNQSPVERDSMLKIIYAVAVEKYGHNGPKSQNTVRLMLDTVQRRGLKLSDDTIRRFLQMAEQRLSHWKD